MPENRFVFFLTIFWKIIFWSNSHDFEYFLGLNGEQAAPILDDLGKSSAGINFALRNQIKNFVLSLHFLVLYVIRYEVSFH